MAGIGTNKIFLPYEEIYLTNYYYPINPTSPFEVITEKYITGIKYKDYYEIPSIFRRANSKFIKAKFNLIFSFLLLL